MTGSSGTRDYLHAGIPASAPRPSSVVQNRTLSCCWLGLCDSQVAAEYPGQSPASTASCAKQHLTVWSQIAQIEGTAPSLDVPLDPPAPLDPLAAVDPPAPLAPLAFPDPVLLAQPVHTTTPPRRNDETR
jgi:hypothetical protein